MSKSDDKLIESFKNKLIERGFSVHGNEDDIYELIPENGDGIIVTAKFMGTKPTNISKHGSHNGNTIQSIGYFKIGLHSEDKKPDFYIFAFSTDNLVDYIIIPREELKRRLISRNLVPQENEAIELVFWLMPDRFLYETTKISIEGEWYYLSKDVDGRMADSTDMDYSIFLNNWGHL